MLKSIKNEIITISSFNTIYMYQKKNNMRLYKRLINWLKRKILIIITAFMLGISNSMEDEDKSVFGNQHNIEQQDTRN